MYPPQIHRSDDWPQAVRLMQHFPLAQVLAIHQGQLFTSPLPLLYEAQPTKYGALLGHVDRRNPLVEAMQTAPHTEIIFQAPSAYISPTAYTSEQLPTWNYQQVKLRVHIETLPDTAVRDLLCSMVDHWESPESTYTLPKNHPQFPHLLPHVWGFRATILEAELLFKMSQNRTEIDRKHANQALENQYVRLLKNFFSSTDK